MRDPRTEDEYYRDCDEAADWLHEHTAACSQCRDAYPDVLGFCAIGWDRYGLTRGPSIVERIGALNVDGSDEGRTNT